jgi:hypothetical protein
VTILNREYRISVIESQYRHIYMVRLYKPTLDVYHAISPVLPPFSYWVSLVEYDFLFRCADETKARELYQFLKESYHLSNLKKLSLILKKYPLISFRSNPRKTKTKANRIYQDRKDKTVPKLEYIVRSKWLRDNGIKTILDCFQVPPMLVIKNSSFRSFNYDEIEKRLRLRGMRANIAARYMNRGKAMLREYGFHAAYRHFARQIANLSKPTYTPLHPFHHLFLTSVEELTFIR